MNYLTTKSARKVLVFLMAITSVVSCTLEKYTVCENEEESAMPVSSKGIYGENSDDFVDDALLEDFLHYQNLAEGKKDVVRTSQIEYKGETVAYLVEYQEGWEIVSACKRTRAVIAHDEKGDTKTLEIAPISAWLQTVYEEIFFIAHLSEGWGEQYDNGFYSTTGEWNINGYQFNDGRSMICDFQTIVAS